MITTNLFQSTEARKLITRKGIFAVIEYQKDLSISFDNAANAYFASQMNLRKRQVVAQIKEPNGVILQAGAMQLMIGQLQASSNVKGMGDLLGKFVGGAVTGESAVKPRYSGNGILVLEPTYKYILLEDLSEWEGGMVIDDGMFLACEESVRYTITARKNLSSAISGGKGLFNTKLDGKGIAVLESYIPEQELITVNLENDVLKVDGNMAIAWSGSLDFTVEKATKSILGSIASGEGLVNVYRGTGKVLLAPVI